jgi:hypothetical protein
VSDSREQFYFWQGYELALFYQLPHTHADDWVWSGWAYGAAEKGKFFQVDKRVAIRRWVRDFLRINFYWLKKSKLSKLRLHPSFIDVRGDHSTKEQF